MIGAKNNDKIDANEEYFLKIANIIHNIIKIIPKSRSIANINPK